MINWQFFPQVCREWVKMPLLAWLLRQINLHQQKAKSAFADWCAAHEVPALNLVKGGLCLLLPRFQSPALQKC